MFPKFKQSRLGTKRFYIFICRFQDKISNSKKDLQLHQKKVIKMISSSQTFCGKTSLNFEEKMRLALGNESPNEKRQ